MDTFKYCELLLRLQHQVQSTGSGERLLRAGIQEAREALTDWVGLESAGKAVLAFAFAVDSGHSDLIGGLWFQANDGDQRHVC